MFVARRLILVGCLIWLGGTASMLAAEPVDADELFRQIRSTVLDAEAAVSLRAVELELGMAVLDVRHGVLIPARSADGHIIELVFVGQARFRLDAPDDIEAGQLELFTGRDRIDTPVEEAVLVVADTETVSRLLDRPAPREIRPSLLTRAKELHANWLLQPERRDTGVEAAIFKFMVGDRAYRNYFAIWAQGYELGDFVYQLDPEDVEQITLARFVPLDVRGWDRRRLQRHIKLQQRKGRWLGVRMQDLGAWDIWLSTPWTPAEGEPLPGHVGFEAEHYVIDARIAPRTMMLRGVARIDLLVESSGRRVIPLELYRDLRVLEVVDGHGRRLPSFRSGKEVLVYLSEPSVKGEKKTIEVTYEGRVLKWVGGKTFDLEDTSGWHPHCGTIDRATYDVKLTWPKKYDLIASGTMVDGGRNGRSLWERRRLDQPSIAFSFVVGDFIIERTKVGHVEVTVAFNRAATSKISSSPAQAMETVARSLTFFEETYGPYPMDELTVVTLPRRYSQSYLGFVTLSDSFLRGSVRMRPVDLELLRDTTIAHEVAHQWWGNLVGWWSYRDQWLSEAMATYSSLLYYSHVLGEGTTYLPDMSAGWREQLNQTTYEGRTIESLGPIVLGGRLASSLSGSAYQAIVYRKGAVVLAMLARSFGEPKFLAMLRSLVEAASNRVLTTDSFLAAIERMSGDDLDGFARQYVYGTGIPQIYYNYTSEPDEDGGWVVRGEARQRADPRYAHLIVRDADGRWDVSREVILDGTPVSGLRVPYRVTLGDDGDERRSTVRDVKGGFVYIDSKLAKFEIETPNRPLELQIDPYGEILARFYSENLHPKRSARLRAHDLAIEGKLQQSEERYLAALALRPEPDGKQDALPPQRRVKSDKETEDARIRLALARLYIDQGRLDEASDQLEAVDELLGPSDPAWRMDRDTLASRIDIRRGDHASAYKRLKKTLRHASPRGGPRTWRAMLREMQLKSERMAMNEAYALLAIAAWETHHPEELSWARSEAHERGVDVSLLDR